MQTEIIKINPVAPEFEKLRICAKVLQDGGLVAFPTETVYGIGANVLDKEALERLHEIKKRPQQKAFTIHISDKAKVDEFAKDVPALAYKCIDAFWPGPLTIIVKSRDNQTVGLRMPSNIVARRLLDETAVPVAVPSANFSGEKPATSAEEVIRNFNGLVDIIIDAGVVEVGVESTIVDFTGKEYAVVREGAIKKNEIGKIAATKNILFVCTGNSCRSVMAEALFKRIMKDRPEIRVSSAGTASFGGLKPSTETMELLRKERIDVSAHRSQPLSDEMIKMSDLIFAMERAHQDVIVQRVPSARERVYLLKEFARIGGMDLDIPDPIGRTRGFYEEVFYIIKDSLNKIKDLI